MRYDQLDIASERKSLLSGRDVAAVMFRHRRAVSAILFGTLGATLLYGLLATRTYQSEMKILDRHGRTDPFVTAERNDTSPQLRSDVLEEELYSEVELIRSRDVLQKTVVATGLFDRKRYGFLARFLPATKNNLLVDPDRDPRVVAAVKQLDDSLKAQPIKKTNLIDVTYDSPDPVLSARVLESLAGFYMAKHLEVHSSPAASQFFEGQMRRSELSLKEVQSNLQKFNASKQVHDAGIENQVVLAKMGEFQANLRQIQVALADSRRRQPELVAQLESVPDRYITQVRTNPQLMQQLKGSLLSLELRHSQMLSNYDPSYRPLQEIQNEIDQTKAAIKDAEAEPLQEETTDSDPAHLWLREELVKSRADAASLQAREQATKSALQQYERQSAELTKNGLIQADLMRQLKLAEEDYVLYQRRHEESVVNGALDQQRILNLSIVQPPFVPVVPRTPRWSWTLLTGGVLAFIGSLGAGFGLEYLDPTFKTPTELKEILGVPLLAAVPSTER